MWQIKKVLVLAPHTDDAELGTGGVLNRFVTAGTEVFSVAFSTAKESLPPGLPADTLIHEVRAASKILGLPEQNLKTLDYPVRHFPGHRQEILEELIRLRSEIRPDLVLVLASTDVHQDHATIFQEAVRAFKKTTIWGYELPWNIIEFKAHAVIALEEKHIETKMAALSAYKSQAHRLYTSTEVVRGLARTRGVMIDASYAEAFEVIRLVIR